MMVVASASIVALVLASSTSITHSFRLPSPTATTANRNNNYRHSLFVPIVVNCRLRAHYSQNDSNNNYHENEQEMAFDITRNLFPEERDGGGIGRRQQSLVSQSSMNDRNSMSDNISGRRQLSSLSKLAIDPVRGGIISSFSSAFNNEEKSEMNNRRPPTSSSSIVGRQSRTQSTGLDFNDSSGQTQVEASVLYQRMRGIQRQQDNDGSSSSYVLYDQRRMKQLQYVENEKLKRELMAAEISKIEKDRLIAIFEESALAKQQQEHENARRKAEQLKDEQLSATESARVATEKATLEKDLLLAEANRLRQEIIDEDARLEAERLEHDRLNTEAAKLASKTATLEKERLLEEAERLRQEIVAEESRLEDERLERERVKQVEVKLEKERLMVVAERMKQQTEVEVARLEAERFESEKIAADVAKMEKERLMVQKQVDEARIAAEQLESTKLAAELAKLETERLMAKAQRLKQEKDTEEARIEAERLEQQRIAAEAVKYAEIQRLEKEKLVAETARIQAEKVAAEAERIKQEKLVNEARLEVEKLERERQKQEVARQAEFERLENERILRDKLADEALLEVEQLKRQRLVEKVARQDDLERLEKMRLIASRKRVSVVGDYDKAALLDDEMIKKKYRDVKAMMSGAKTLTSVDRPSRSNMNTVARGATPTTLSEIEQNQLLRGDEEQREESATYLDIAKVFRGQRPGQRDSNTVDILRAPMVVAGGNRSDDYDEESFDITRRHFDSDRGSFMLRVNSGSTRRRGTTSGQVVSGSYDDWVGRSRAARLGRPMAEIISEEDDEDILYEPTRPRVTATGQAVSGSYDDWVGRSRKAVLGRRISVESKAKEDVGDIITEPRFLWRGVEKDDVGYLDAHRFSKLDRTSSTVRDAKNIIERRTRQTENQSGVDSTDIYNLALLSTKKGENREEDKVSQPEEVMYWLLTHLPNLQEEDAIAYFNQLLDEGFDSSDVLNEIVDEDLHFMKKGHRKGLMRSLRGVDTVTKENAKDDAAVNKSGKTSSADAFGDMVADMMLPDYVPDSVEDAIGDAIGDAIENVAKFLHGDTVTKDDAGADKSETPSSADAFGDMVADMMIPDYVPDSVEDAIGNAIGDAIDSVTKFLQGDTGKKKSSTPSIADTGETTPLTENNDGLRYPNSDVL